MTGGQLSSAAGADRGPVSDGRTPWHEARGRRHRTFRRRARRAVAHGV